MAQEHIVPLRIAILDNDVIFAPTLKLILENIPDVTSVHIFEQTDQVAKGLKTEDVNSVLIDIFQIGISSSIELISLVRTQYPYIPICLIGNKEPLLVLPDVPKKWAARFSHYIKLPKDQTLEELKKSSEETVSLLGIYLRHNKASVALRAVRKLVTHRTSPFDQVALDQAKEIEHDLAEAEEILEIKPKDKSYLIIQGFEGDDVKSLVKDTLEKASKALDGTARVNKWILICGMLLVVASFVVATITQRAEALAFGGFGMAGVIASLITNPLKSIGMGAKRLIQLQVAYVGFLKHLTLLDISTQGNVDVTVLERSKQLNDAISAILKCLDENYK